MCIKDVYVLDRGFRDVRKYLEEQRYTILMPALKGQRGQLTTEESNESGLVTKIRWVIEAIDGILEQKFKLLHNQLHNSLLPNAELFCKIDCFLQNRFGKRLNSDAGYLDKIIERINLMKTKQNTITRSRREKLESKNFHFSKCHQETVR